MDEQNHEPGDNPEVDDRIGELVLKAAGELGSEYKLAQHLGITSQELSGIKRGRRACPVDVQAVMASIAGEDPVKELVTAVRGRLSATRERNLAAALWEHGQLDLAEAVRFELTVRSPLR